MRSHSIPADGLPGEVTPGAIAIPAVVESSLVMPTAEHLDQNYI